MLIDSFLCSWILWGILSGHCRDGLPLLHKVWGLGCEELRVQVVLGRLHFHIWYLGWVDLMTRTADCSTSPWSLASSQHRVIGFLILHTEIPNMYFSEQGRSWIAFYDPALGHFCCILWVEAVRAYTDSRRGKRL